MREKTWTNYIHPTFLTEFRENSIELTISIAGTILADD